MPPGKKFHVNMNLKGQVKAAKRGATKGMKQAAEVLEGLIKEATPIQRNRRTPYLDGYGKHGGALKKSVTVKAVGGKNPRLEIRSHDYGLWVDQGGPNNSPTGFITGTMRANRKSVVAGIAKETKKAMKAEAKKKPKRAKRRKK